MPPPPPPSKSYLLVIDTDSSDDEEAQDSYRIHHGGHAPIVSDYQDDFPELLLMEGANLRRPHVIEDEEDSATTDPAGTSLEFEGDDDSCCSQQETSTSEKNRKKTLTKNQKKKRSRRRNKKKTKSCAIQSRRISFSNVSFRTYPRAFSEVSVPGDGGWPLGMELKPLLEGAPPETTVEDFESSKQEKLKARWEHLLQTKTVDDKVLEQMTKRPDNGMPFELETRQWDYLSKTKNPLFGMLSEEQRQSILLESCSEEEEAYFPPEERARSNSMGDHTLPSSPGKGRSRSASFSHSKEQFNEKYNQVYVHHVRSELETLRIERSKSGATGCNCRKLTVYIPPKNGGGKKAQHRRLKPSKLRDELKKRNLFDESKSREELEKILHDAVEQEPCCGTVDCFCYRNGINCQTDACSCWHDSHVHVKGESKGGYLSLSCVKERCGNPRGTSAVDVDAIDDYRSRVLESGICQFIDAAQ